MKTRLLLSVFAAGLSLASGMALVPSQAAPVAGNAAPASTKPMSIYDFKMKSLDGKEIDFKQYKGKVLLILNTASKCGNTKQYAQLQQLHEKYAGKGLVILGFPANDFGGQEPGSDSEIGVFCQKNYGVTFQMFSKVVVKGNQKAPLFQYLTKEANPALAGEITWNFGKFLISRDGKLVSRFDPKTIPDNPQIVSAIETELGKK
jgi:glutathione peroxidase